MEKSSSKKKQYKLSGSLIESLHQAQKVANRIKPILPYSRYVEKIYPLLENHLKYTQKMVEEFTIMQDQKYLQFYEEYGWLDWMAWRSAMSLYYKYKAGKDTFLEEFNNYLKDNDNIDTVASMILKYNVLSRRDKYILKILGSHKNGDYICSIPLGIIQIEGIIRDLGVLRGVLENTKNPEYRIQNGRYKLNEKGKKNKAPFGGICVELFGDKEKILTKEVKQPLTKKLKDEIYSKDLRHSIMHGNYVGYEDEVLSANLIAVIVSLSFKAVEIERISKINPYWNKQEG